MVSYSTSENEIQLYRNVHSQRYVHWIFASCSELKFVSFFGRGILVHNFFISLFRGAIVIYTTHHHRRCCRRRSLLINRSLISYSIFQSVIHIHRVCTEFITFFGSFLGKSYWKPQRLRYIVIVYKSNHHAFAIFIQINIGCKGFFFMEKIVIICNRFLWVFVVREGRKKDSEGRNKRLEVFYSFIVNGSNPWNSILQPLFIGEMN